MARDRFETALTVVLVACAVIVTGAVVRHEFWPSPSEPVGSGAVFEKDWARYDHSTKSLGASHAPIEVLEFADFQCPYCRRFAAVLDSLTALYPGQVRVVFRHYPLSMHPFAHMAALTAECATNQGSFESYSRELFHDRDSLGTLSWQAEAERAGVPDLVRFGRCIRDQSTVHLVQADSLAGDSLHLTGTPLVIVNGWRFDGAPSLDQVRDVINRKR